MRTLTGLFWPCVYSHNSLVCTETHTRTYTHIHTHTCIYKLMKTLLNIRIYVCHILPIKSPKSHTLDLQGSIYPRAILIVCFAVSLNLRCDQYPSCGPGYVFWRSTDEEVEAKHHGSGQVCLWHVTDRLHPVTVVLRNELRERQGSRGDAFL